ncbi:hypothetical protein L7F22_036077 [Adiantum nelumboides]|nr:hypothetical protein [Adiantum nelumboides]
MEMQKCDPTDQFCTYRYIAQHENTTLRALSLLLLEKNDCLELDAAIPMHLAVEPIQSFWGLRAGREFAHWVVTEAWVELENCRQHVSHRLRIRSIREGESLRAAVFLCVVFGGMLVLQLCTWFWVAFCLAGLSTLLLDVLLPALSVRLTPGMNCGRKSRSSTFARIAFREGAMILIDAWMAAACPLAYYFKGF